MTIAERKQRILKKIAEIYTGEQTSEDRKQSEECLKGETAVL